LEVSDNLAISTTNEKFSFDPSSQFLWPATYITTLNR